MLVIFSVYIFNSTECKNREDASFISLDILFHYLKEVKRKIPWNRIRFRLLSQTSLRIGKSMIMMVYNYSKAIPI